MPELPRPAACGVPLPLVREPTRASSNKDFTRERRSQASTSGRELSRTSSTPSIYYRKKRKPKASPGKDGRIDVPVTVAERLAHFRAKRTQQNRADLTLSNLLSLTAVQREMHLRTDRERSSSAGTKAASSGSFARHGSAREALGAIGRAVVGSFDPLADPKTDGFKSITYVSPEVNKKIRTQLLRQHWLSNRFQGSAEAARAEIEFYVFVSRYQLRRVRVRLAISAFGLLFSGIEPIVSRTERLVPYLVLKTVVP